MATEGCKEFMLFGTRIVIDTMRKTASFSNLSDYQHVADAANPTVKAAGGYASDHVVKVGAGRERKRGTPWSEEEHKRFLMGLQKVGKGDWRAISKNFVRTRTPTQVASHAQKYFIRHTTFKSRRRSSLFDITTETVNCQVTGKATEEKPESANGDGPSSQPQSQTLGSSNTCLPPVVPVVPTQTSPVLLAPVTITYPLASSISSQVTGQQMTIRPPAPVALQLFPTLNSNSVRNYSPLSLKLGLSLPSHRQGSPNPAFRTKSNLMSKDSYVSVA